MTSKRQRVLEMLQAVGSEGIHSFELHNIGGWRYAARIGDLKKEGYDIWSVKEKRGDAVGCPYFLKGLNEST